MITKLQAAINKRDQDREGGAALIFAVLLVMVLMLIMVLVTTTAVTSATSARSLSTTDMYRNAAETAVANALLEGNNATFTPPNNGLEARRGIANASTGTMPASTSNSGTDIKWQWYTQQVVFPGERVGYYVYATGYSAKEGIDDGITLRAQFLPKNVQEGFYDTATGKTSYRFPWSSPFQWGVTGFNAVTISGSAKIYSADSKYGSNASGTATVGTVASTNGIMSVTSTTPSLVDKSFLSPAITGTSCNGAGCNLSGTTYRGYKLDSGTTNNRVTTSCPGSTYPVWKASENGGVLNMAANSCVGGLIFDIPTILTANWSEGTPLTIFNIGDTTIYQGVQVNKTNIPTALRIYSRTGNANIGNPATSYSGATTTASMSFYTGAGSCNVYNATTYFGAMACGNLSLMDGSTFYLDLASINIATNVQGTGSGYANGSRNIWYQQYIEQL